MNFFIVILIIKYNPKILMNVISRSHFLYIPIFQTNPKHERNKGRKEGKHFTCIRLS